MFLPAGASTAVPGAENGFTGAIAALTAVTTGRGLPGSSTVLRTTTST